MTAFQPHSTFAPALGCPPEITKAPGRRKNNGLPQVIIISKTILCEVARVIAAHKDQYLSSWY
jgi:hypothetical protein